MGYGLKRVSERWSDALTQVGWQELEKLLAGYYRGQGFDVEHCGTGGTRARFDGGVDLKLRREGEYVLVQAKHWNTRQVPHNAVHELLGITVNEGATGAILVTSGEFTKAAVQAATRQGHVELVDGEDLRTMLGAWTRTAVPATATVEPGARWRRGAMDISRYAGERLLAAAEEGLRNGRYLEGARRRASQALMVVITKALLATALMLVLAFGVSRCISGVTAEMSQPQVQRAAPMQPAQGPPNGAAPLRPSSRAPAEILPGPAPAPSAAELREQQRRADEAMKVIEASTPEM